MKLHIDRARLVRELDELGAISEAPPPVVTRVVFTDADLRGRAYLKQLCAEANLQVREDAAGNTFARWEGAEPGLPAVATGSHIDAIPNAGKYDGVVGVLGGLEAVRALRQSGFIPKRSIELILFTSEEPTRFDIGCLGSRLLSGSLSAEAAKKLTDKDGATIDQVRRPGLRDSAAQGSHRVTWLGDAARIQFVDRVGDAGENGCLHAIA